MGLDLSTGVMLANLAIYNIAIIRLLTFVLSKIDFASALSEKSPPTVPVMPAAGVAIAPVPGPGDTSYSRVVGTIGAIVLASFFWAVGNVILFKAFGSITEIKEFVASLGTFFLAGAAMFLPYAFNQLRSAFN